MDLKARAELARKQLEQVDGALKRAAKNATMRAVEEAQERTPPNGGLSGTNTRSGELKAHWATDSKVNPQKRGDSYVTALANDKEYASYVNDGHRMDRHFVPGLVINEASGMLEYNPDGTGGIIVGTRTSYVKGLHMVDAAKEKYHRVLKSELEGLEAILE